jgi:dolichol kinase
MQGYELLYKKYMEEYKKRPNVHADYLIQFSIYLILNSYIFKALKKILYAFYLVKFNPVIIIKYSRKLYRKINRHRSLLRKSKKQNG